MAFLIQVNEETDRAILPLGRSVMLIGRDEDSNLYLEASEISKNHASIFSADGFYHLKDNGSTNGTMVNGQKVNQHRLVHGDMIQFGPYLFQVDLKNPLPEGSVTMEEADLRHSGNSYTSSVRLKEVKGAEKSGQLHVVMGANEPPTPPKTPVELPCSGLLASMSAEERKTLAALGSIRLANPGATIIQQGQETSELMLVLSGKLEARLDGVAEPVGMINEGDWIGELNIFDPSGAGCSVIAVTETTYWGISRSNLEGFLSSNQSAGIQLLVGLASTLGSRLRQTLQGKTRPSKPNPVHPWIIAAAATGVAVLAGLGFFNERQNTGFQIAEMSSLIQEKETELIEVRKKAEEFKERLDTKETIIDRVVESKNSAEKQLELVKKISEPHEQDSELPQQVESRSPSVPDEPDQESPDSGEDSAQNPDILYPSEVLITKKTQIPLVTGGGASGSLTLSEGVELLVLGVDGDNVIVEVGGSAKSIPKGQTNFSDALREYIASQPVPQASASPSPIEPAPQSTPLQPQAPTPSIFSRDREPVGPASFEDISEIVEMVDLLEVLAEVQDLHKGSKNDITRFVRIQERRWSKAAERASEVLARGNAPEDYRLWLTKIIETSNMFNVARFPLLEGQLRILDKEWISFQTIHAAQGNE